MCLLRVWWSMEVFCFVSIRCCFLSQVRYLEISSFLFWPKVFTALWAGYDQLIPHHPHPHPFSIIYPSKQPMRIRAIVFTPWSAIWSDQKRWHCLWFWIMFGLRFHKIINLKELCQPSPCFMLWNWFKSSFTLAMIGKFKPHSVLCGPHRVCIGNNRNANATSSSPESSKLSRILSWNLVSFCTLLCQHFSLLGVVMFCRYAFSLKMH
jgi:hypothetical protein